MPRAFAIAAHPDDIEFWMSGTLMLLKQVGFDVHYMNVANGCCGSTQWDSEHTATVRKQEAMRAADAIGAAFHPSLVKDLEIFYDDPTVRSLAAIVRDVAPQIILTHSPIDYMEDHTNTCRLVVSAAFARGMPNYSTSPPRTPTGEPVTIYHAQPHGNRDPFGQLIRPTTFVDVTSVMTDKLQMLACHESQRAWLDESQGMDSYLESMCDMLRETGNMSARFEYAEGWRRHLHFGFCGANDDPLADALAEFVHHR